MIVMPIVSSHSLRASRLPGVSRDIRDMRSGRTDRVVENAPSCKILPKIPSGLGESVLNHNSVDCMMKVVAKLTLSPDSVNLYQIIT